MLVEPLVVNPYLNVHPLEAVPCYRDPRLHMIENDPYLLKLGPNIFLMFKS